MLTRTRAKAIKDYLRQCKGGDGFSIGDIIEIYSPRNDRMKAKIMDINETDLTIKVVNINQNTSLFHIGRGLYWRKLTKKDQRQFRQDYRNQSQSGLQPQTEPEIQSDPQPQTEPETKSGPQPQTQSERQSQPRVEPESEPAPVSVPRVKIESAPPTYLDNETDSDATETDSDATETDSDATETDTDTETKTEQDMVSESGTASGPQIKLEPQNAHPTSASICNYTR